MIKYQKTIFLLIFFLKKCVPYAYFFEAITFWQSYLLFMSYQKNERRSLGLFETKSLHLQRKTTSISRSQGKINCVLSAPRNRAGSLAHSLSGLFKMKTKTMKRCIRHGYGLYPIAYFKSIIMTTARIAYNMIYRL